MIGHNLRCINRCPVRSQILIPKPAEAQQYPKIFFQTIPFHVRLCSGAKRGQGRYSEIYRASGQSSVEFRTPITVRCLRCSSYDPTAIIC
jgi:hypothetical protein